MNPPPPADHPPADAPEPSAGARRDRFLSDSPERVRDLSAALGRLRIRDPDALAELRRCFAELAASASALGLSAIADRCVAAGAAVTALAGRPLPIPRDDLVALERHVLRVAEAFRLQQPRGGDAGPP